MYNLAGATLNGMYHTFELLNEQERDTPLFENIKLYPGGTVYANEFEDGYEIPPMNKDSLIDEIMEYHGELLVLRQNPFRFKKMVEQFFDTNYHNFERIWIALFMDYSPIDNYDRHEYHNNEYDSKMTNQNSFEYHETTTFTPTGTEQDKTTLDGKEKTVESQNGEEKVTTSPNNNSKEITEELIAADNSSTYQPDKKTEHTQATIDTTTTFGSGNNKRSTETEIEYGSSNTTRSDTTVRSFDNRQDETIFKHQPINGDIKDIHSGNDYLTIWAHGNIGVAKTSEIITDEIKLRAFNFYEYVADLFETKLLLQIY